VNQYWQKYKEIMRHTRAIGIGAASLLLLFVLQEAVAIIWEYTVAESNSPDLRMHFILYMSWLVVLCLALSARVYILANSSKRGYSAEAISSVLVFVLVTAFLYEYLPRTQDHTVCEADGQCFTIYEMTRPIYVLPAAILYVFLGVARACITYFIAVLLSIRKLK